MDVLVQKLLKTGHQDTLDSALEYLFKTDLPAYDALMEVAEANSESCAIEVDGQHYNALLIAAPILAWTRFSIASGPIPAEIRTALNAHMHAHLLAPNTKLALAPTLFSIDQLPRSHAETYALTHRMAQAALKDATPRSATNLPETAPFLADTRYLVAAVVAPVGEPIFTWQATLHLQDRDHALAQWRAQAGPNVTRLLPGCSIELLLPEAYFVACREADKRIRPASIHAAVHYLTHTLNVSPQDLRAIIGAFSEDPGADRIDEYRIGFALRHSPEIVYGVVWPLYGQEDADDLDPTTLADTLPNPEEEDTDELRTPLEEILALLRESGVVHVKRHSERFPTEFCDDCGAPLYPDPEAELVHAEMPEDVPSGTGHFH